MGGSVYTATDVRVQPTKENAENVENDGNAANTANAANTDSDYVTACKL